MQLTINKKYLLLPVSSGAVKKVLLFYHNKKLVYELSTRIDYLAPEYFFPVDMHPFQGLTLDILCNPDMKLDLHMTDIIPELPESTKRYRPFLHFTVNQGWHNDPNGLIQINGEYHMFYQYNPADSEWGNMHWGHAVSKDLFHWQEQDVALYPDEMGTMFSGSAIIDSKNSSGLSKNGEPAILLFYTAAGNTSEHSKYKLFTQCIAYSTDRGKSFVKYEHNPVVQHIQANNRDPKVIFSTELNKYVMALFLESHQYCLLVSDDLLKWEKLQDITLNDDSECPDLFPLAVNGNKENIKWVFCGASDFYLVGSFMKGKFVAEQEPKRLFHGRVSYAAQTFSDVLDGRRIRIAWDRLKIPNSPFNSQMGVPCQLNLIEEDNQYYLCAQPVSEIASLYKNVHIEENLLVETNEPFKLDLQNKAYDISLTISERLENNFSLTIFGQIISYNFDSNQIIFKDNKIPAKIGKGPFTMRMIVDKLSIEIFNDLGRVAICNSCICDYNLNNMEVHSDSKLLIDKLLISEIEI
ncbi:MAG TPA: glycoside hydrolase family 32 protein [Clostridiales bacterium]|nr:glycoside hydrolase family 32 protein [Clostridiales bacterium]